MAAGYEDDVLFLEIANTADLLLVDLIFHCCLALGLARVKTITILALHAWSPYLVALTEHFYLFYHVFELLNYQSLFQVLRRQFTNDESLQLLEENGFKGVCFLEDICEVVVSQIVFVSELVYSIIQVPQDTNERSQELRKGF